MALAQSHPPRETFGPDSERPLLAFQLAGADAGLAEWLRGLRCPVIGIGNGPLADACDVALADERELAILVRNIERAPIAAMVLVQHLRASESLSLEHAVMAESFAYATLQQGPEFRQWLEKRGVVEAPTVSTSPVESARNGNTISITLNDPDNHNAIGAHMRDALCEALDVALAERSIERVRLTGAGRMFSSGGQVVEFGQVSDPATAHWIRSLRLPATRLAALSERLEVHVNGGAIGAGAEIAAFGGRVTAAPSAWFQLPELKYGLIPGAGGTASLPRRIGRQRAAWLALSMKRIDAQTALDWGLVDEIVS